ncbi:hypothetical protein [Priestia megaterium]|uniref:hypothetical protein n=1 Tax=Priestia megaterium TaxID=1404 RepID=UPI000BF3156C|nr:hypothetical protein [Priestia megaterium]PFR93550.1 hypothetical protein COK39_17835 [Priestia megaterium]
MLEKWGISFNFSVSNGRINYESFGTKDDVGVNLNISFQNFNILEQLSKNPYEVIEVDGSQVRSISTSYKDIEIPFSEDMMLGVVKVIPHPLTSMKVELSLPSTDEYMEDVLLESYGQNTVDIVRFTHSLFKFTFDFRNSTFRFKVNELSNLRQAKRVYGFLNELINTKHQELIIHPLEATDANGNPVNEGSFTFNMDNEQEQRTKNDICYINKLVTDLLLIQKHYKVRFKEFYFNLSKEELDMVQLLLLNISGEKQTLSNLRFNIDLNDSHTDREALKEIIQSKTPVAISIVYNQGIHVPLFDITIPIKDKKLIIASPDSVIENTSEISKALKRKGKIRTDIKEIRLSSKKDKLVRYFE